jgi:hypothetical protein
MIMLYKFSVDFIVLFHFAFILFVLFGGLLVLRWRRLAWVHVPSFVWGSLTELFGLWCPLTPLENWLRWNGGQTGYDTGFIDHYIMPIVYPVGLTREIQMVLGAAVILLNVGIYSLILRRALRRRGKA